MGEDGSVTANMSLDKRGCGPKSTFGVNTGASSKAGARQLEDRGEGRMLIILRSENRRGILESGVEHIVEPGPVNLHSKREYRKCRHNCVPD